MDSYNIWKEAMFTMLCCLASVRRLPLKNLPPKTQIHSLLIRTSMVQRSVQRLSYPVHCHVIRLCRRPVTLVAAFKRR